jgi:hypothetical protein
MQAVLGMFTGIAGLLGIVGSMMAMRFWLITLVIMIILKLTGAVAMPWFAGMFTAGAISTGLFMLFGGFVFMGISFIITAIGAALMDN